MEAVPTHKAMYNYFRMALVTGLVDREAVIAWADQELLLCPRPSEELMDLSLSGRLPYSQMIRLLNAYQEPPDFGLPLQMVFARAGLLLEGNPHRTGDLIMGLRLLAAEERIDPQVKRALCELDGLLDAYHQSLVSFDEVARRLEGFLEPYNSYRRWVYPPP
jgi:hypothetical protein